MGNCMVNNVSLCSVHTTSVWIWFGGRIFHQRWTAYRFVSKPYREKNTFPREDIYSMVLNYRLIAQCSQYMPTVQLVVLQCC